MIGSCIADVEKDVWPGHQASEERRIETKYVHYWRVLSGKKVLDGDQLPLRVTEIFHTRAYFEGVFEGRRDDAGFNVLGTLG